MAELLRVRARGVREVESTWQKFVPSARLDRVDPQTFSFNWTSVQSERFTIVGYDLNATVRSAVAPEDQLMACRIATPDGWVGTAKSDLDAGLPWLTGDGPTRARWSGAAQVRAFVFDRPLVEQVARQVSGNDRLVLRVRDAGPRNAAAALQWERSYRYVLEAFGMLLDSGTHDEILEAELRRHALASTLAAFDTTFLDAIERVPQTRAAPATVRRAVMFIDEHAHEPITIDDIAAAAQISTRGLQYAFRRAMDMTPMEYLRDVRLAGAHADLQRGAGTVAEVARRWGFGSPSRFAGYYRARFGRNPGRARS